ncbi:hypothetical protein GQ43DRAFT_17478 [Delitschia confertaspora ATCC 74209]|uniref:Uncharacterized protein n=1 Tax=Delitschia confertaspora ATCC 74209 TaxID=1513339 RepID=A0A9P4MZI6_9PLEO|nr:hypothetical protein GQ43DRAFT_17478 [Delitschia confertaspora ATCC 74209]
MFMHVHKSRILWLFCSSINTTTLLLFLMFPFSSHTYTGSYCIQVIIILKITRQRYKVIEYLVQRQEK